MIFKPLFSYPPLLFTKDSQQNNIIENIIDMHKVRVTASFSSLYTHTHTQTSPPGYITCCYRLPKIFTAVPFSW